MNDIVVSAVGVTKLLKGLNPSKALGPDELHPRVLKELASKLGLVFAHLFQQSIDTGEIPKEWSLANICPFFKNGDRSLACNYCPVSQDRDQDSLLVKRRNDNHSPGPVIRELVPSSHQRSELSNTILCIFSG